MYFKLGSVSLRSGEQLEGGVIKAPDHHWKGPLSSLLLHKGELWRWQLQELLTDEHGVDAWHYVVVRAGAIVSHILTVEHGGVGVLGHVWTQPDDRGKGAASSLMEVLLNHFDHRDGKALYLGTTYDSPAYHIYRKHGFTSVEAESGVMARFTGFQSEFEERHFSIGMVDIEALDWSDWATAPALICGDFPGLVRCAPLKLFGRQLTEGPLLSPLQARFQPYSMVTSSAKVNVLRKRSNGALVGLAAYAPDQVWPDSMIVDVYCHPNFWDYANLLLKSLELPSDSRLAAYTDDLTGSKHRVLTSAGFEVVAKLPNWLAREAAGSGYVDVLLLRNGEAKK